MTGNSFRVEMTGNSFRVEMTGNSFRVEMTKKDSALGTVELAALALRAKKYQKS